VARVTRVAAIDCGTHSIRLLVADASGDGGQLVDLVRRMEIVRLGEGVDRTGRLSKSAMARTRDKLAEYATTINELGAERTRMVATSATRDAANAGEFKEIVLETLGVPPEVVTGDEEARLSFAGAVAGLPPDLPGPYLVVDIGGGSTELVVGDRERGDGVIATVSVNVGCLRMTERHLRSDPPTGHEISEACVEISAALDAALAAVPSASARTLIGLAGSVTTVAGIALDLDSYRPDLIHGAVLDYPAVARVVAGLLTSTRAERLAIPVMHPGRVDVIGAGALILRTVLEKAGFERVVASEHDILDGIALSLVSSR
jgi:exopolyphosphatase/guanosine-5'-triphosphate,3'-diphosphate pyrophosphatase